MSKCLKESNGSSSEKESKDKKPNFSALSEKKKSDFQTTGRVNSNVGSVKIFKGNMTKKGGFESLVKSKISFDSVYNIDDMSSEELHDSVHRIEKNPTEPFKFLSHLLDDVDVKDASFLGQTKPTDIDLQLASLVKRVQMNKSLLERTNQRVKDINFIVEKNKVLASRELNYNKDSLSKMGDYVDHNTEPIIEHPGINELQRTMKDTLQMLECIKKLTSGDAASKELSSEFFSKMELGSVPSPSGKTQLKSTLDIKVEPK